MWPWESKKFALPNLRRNQDLVATIRLELPRPVPSRLCPEDRDALAHASGLGVILVDISDETPNPKRERRFLAGKAVPNKRPSPFVGPLS